MTQQERANKFQSMHTEQKMFILPNAWDAGNAFIFEKQGFNAIATSSAGIAYALGYSDGQELPFEELLAVVRKITKRIAVPLSVDFERGYSEDPMKVKENARKILEAGAVGFNIEDGLPDGTLSPMSEQLEKIKVLVELKNESGINFVINARTCAYWLNVDSDENMLKIAIERGNEFAAAGADCVFVPGALNKTTVKTLVNEINAPLNVILNGVFHDFSELDQLGVRRLSVGSGPARYIYDQVITLADNLMNGNTDLMLKNKFSYSEANIYFSK